MKSVVVTILLVLAHSGLAFADDQVFADDIQPLFPRLLGSWTSDGDAFGQQAESHAEWLVTLDGQFYRINYRIDMRNENEALMTFSGIALYRHDESEGFWADNSGDLHPIVTTREKRALVAHWGKAGGKQGRTRYELLPDDTLVITDWIQSDDEWRQFNKNQFHRVSPQNEE